MGDQPVDSRKGKLLIQCKKEEVGEQREEKRGELGGEGGGASVGEAGGCVLTSSTPPSHPALPHILSDRQEKSCG